MAQVLLIKNDRSIIKDSISRIIDNAGDIIEVFKDTHVFSDIEHEQFNIVKIPDATQQEIVDLIASISSMREPIIKLDAVEGSCIFLKDAMYGEVWKNADGKWCEVVVPVKRMVRLLSSETEMNKALFYSNLVNNYQQITANRNEVPDLNVTEIKV